MNFSRNSQIEDCLTLGYYGPLAEKGRMNSYDVATYIIAFSDFLGIVSRSTFGEKISIKTEIQGFRKDSFDIDFALYIGLVAASLFDTTPFSVKEFLDVIRGCLKVWIHLRGNPPKMTASIPDKRDMFQIENQNGQIVYVSGNVINIINNQKAGEAAEQFIKKPLESDLSNIQLKSKTIGEVTRIEKYDAPYFVPIGVKEPILLQNEMEMVLSIESPNFKEGNKWRFSDGQNSFFAEIVDEDFLKRVDSGIERFGKGDQLVAIVRFTQSGRIESLKLDRTIIKVLKHEILPQTGNLFE